MKLIRVFPRRTNATPMDEMVRIGPPGFFEEAEKVNISVTFTYDIPYAEFLAEQWRHIAPVEIGGPAIGMRGEEFEPGMYLKKGLTITSRGCNNKCWFCSVWKRDGQIRELPIKDGYNIMDDNLLACSDEHIRAVFSMLKRQNKPAKFTGGLEAKLMKPWIAEALYDLKPQYMYFAYDTDDDLEPLIEASTMLQDAGFNPSNHQMMCYVLIGYPQDTFEKAEQRLRQTISAGFMPFSMLYRAKDGKYKREWKQFQRTWTNPKIVGSRMKEMKGETK